MRQKAGICVIILIAALSGYGQSGAGTYSYMYSTAEGIMQKAEYRVAQNELDELSRQWKKEVEEKFEAHGRLYRVYCHREATLTEEKKKRLEQELNDTLAQAEQLLN